MKKLQHFTILISVMTLVASTLIAKDEDEKVKQATTIINRFKTMPEKQIPREVLRDAKGLAILTVAKGGFVWSGKVGEGVMVARTGRGWSGPSFIHTGGIGFGAQIGGEVTEIVLVLNTTEAVQSFANGGNVQLGGALSVAAGPLGRTIEAGVTPRAAVYTYSRSKGLFGGVSLEGTVIDTNEKANERFYHQTVSASDILKGRVSPPKSANQLLTSL